MIVRIMPPNSVWILILLFIVSCSPATGQVSDGKGFDGPAELPRLYVKTSLVDTPAPGHRLRAKDTDGLKDSLRRAACGDTVELQPDVTYAGYFELPDKSCDDAHWIVIRTSSLDSSLPPEGTRINPCYAGVASLPGRPPFPCNSSNRMMARITGAKSETKILTNRAGANHYRFIGLEIADTAANGAAGGYYDLILLKSEQQFKKRRRRNAKPLDRLP